MVFIYTRLDWAIFIRTNNKIAPGLRSEDMYKGGYGKNLVKIQINEDNFLTGPRRDNAD